MGYDSEKESTRRPAFRALVQDFSPFWFTWCMNAGILSLLIWQIPYPFNGSKVLATIFFVLDLVLFIIFSLLFLLRLVWFRRAAYDEITSDTNELMMCACWPIAFMTLTSLTALIVSHAPWGHAFTTVAYVMWWFVAAWSIIFIYWIFTTFIRNRGAAGQRLSFMVILPAVSVSTVAVEGGIIASMSFAINHSMAVPVIIAGFFLVGIGFLFGLILSAYLFHGLIAEGWPDPELTTSMYIITGSMSQSASALQALGSAASTYGMFAGYNRGQFLTAQAALPLDAACTLLALMLTGLAIFWILLATFAMFERAIERKLSWSPGWNSIIFPTGTLCTSFQLLGVGLASATFRVLTCILLILMLIVFFVNAAFTIPQIAKGKLLIVREDPRKQESDKEK